MRKMLYILGELEDADLNWLADAGDSRAVAAGTTIIDQTRPHDTLFIVLDGELSVTSRAVGDREIARLGPGELVGDISLLDSRPPSANVKALQDSLLFTVPQEVVRAKLGRDAPFAARFYRAISIFLANRLSDTVELMSGRTAGPELAEELQEADEISSDALDSVSLAGARFDWFRKRFVGE